MGSQSRVKVDAPETAFVGAVRALLTGIEASFPTTFKGIVRCYLVGGCAVHLYTGYRVSGDMDAKFEPGILLPDTPITTYQGSDGELASLVLDRNYTDVLAMMHPNWQADARPWERFGRIEAMVISPVDLAISKVARFADNDRLDICQLASHGLLSVGEFQARCAEAMDYYVGDLTFVRYNVSDAVALIERCTPTPPRL